MPFTVIVKGFYIDFRGELMDEQRIGKLEHDMTDVKTRLAVAESNIRGIREDIGGIKDNTTWILRLVIGGLVGALLTFIIKGGLF